ncbi:MAG: hypothetical protein M3Y57_01285 [Acidobacteriota bacterium]|nr:hypothetical protein [Acidobacteriota bacterium]
MKTKLLIGSLALCSLLWSQSAGTESSNPDKVVRVVHVHGNAEALANLSGQGSGASVQGSNQLRAVVIKGKTSDVDRVVQTLQDLDTAGAAALDGKNIELVIYVVSGSMEPMTGASDAGAELLAPVYKQLRAVFPYKNYQLLNTMLMRSGQNSEASTSGMMKALQNNPDFNMPGTYAIHYDAATVSGDTSPVIHLAKFTFQAKVPYVTGSLSGKGKDGSIPYATTTNWQQATIGIETNVDLREGQKVVIGTSNVEMASATLFLVVTARMVP